MDTSISYNPLLELLDYPAFLVKDGVIVQANRSAQQKLITPGKPVNAVLGASASAYQEFNGGCLYLTLSLAGCSCGAAVTQAGDMDLFSLDQNSQADQALALAAQQLRAPLHSLFSAVEFQPQLKEVNRGLHQIHRIVTNMADFPRYKEQGNTRAEVTDLCHLFTETVEKAAALVESAGMQLHYTALPQLVIGLADREMLERAVYNLISNAVKFSPKGSILEAKLTAKGNMLYFTVQDQGDGIAPDIMNSIFTRYLRAPGIEDSRHGVGLGLALVRAAAAIHGGTVLIDQPETGGTRVTITITVTHSTDSMLRSPIRLPINDYAGGRDHGLLELSDVLPSNLYNEN